MGSVVWTQGSLEVYGGRAAMPLLWNTQVS